MTMVEAMSDGLSMMADVLGARRKIDDKLVRAYLFVIQEDGLQPEDVESACRWFVRDGEGSFPAGPIFRRRCQVEKSRRETRQRNAIYQSKIEALDDPFSDEAEEIIPAEEAHRIIRECFARLDGKFKNGNPLTRRDRTVRDVRADIQRMRATA